VFGPLFLACIARIRQCLSMPIRAVHLTTRVTQLIDIVGVGSLLSSVVPLPDLRQYRSVIGATWRIRALSAFSMVVPRSSSLMREVFAVSDSLLPLNHQRAVQISAAWDRGMVPIAVLSVSAARHRGVELTTRVPRAARRSTQ
jgi:hypothetical protein